MTNVYELNMDGLVGPSHHYAGLAHGNLASLRYAYQTANPQAAALQGLAKMRFIYRLGIPQAILPPHERPNLTLLRQLGFQGSVSQILEKAWQQAPQILSACYSASSMWTANAATVSASQDTLDGKVHFTAANLVNHLHRHQETAFNQQLLQLIFQDVRYFSHHPPLPHCSVTSDEGAANWNRLYNSESKQGFYIYVYGRTGFTSNQRKPKIYPARQTLEASQAIARAHQIPKSRVLFARQTPRAIDAGVFHHDVIGVANGSVLLLHEYAWVRQKHILKQLQKSIPFPLHILEVKQSEVSLAEAVETYLFNSQLVTLPNGCMHLIAPIECQINAHVQHKIENLIEDSNNPITAVHYFDLKQSMQNGGGPACLRFRVPLSAEELAATHPGILLNESLINQLEHWVKKHYRSQLQVGDLRDIRFIQEIQQALDELTQLLQLGSIYPFQQ